MSNAFIVETITQICSVIADMESGRITLVCILRLSPLLVSAKLLYPRLNKCFYITLKERKLQSK